MGGVTMLDIDEVDDEKRSGDSGDRGDDGLLAPAART